MNFLFFGGGDKKKETKGKAKKAEMLWEDDKALKEEFQKKIDKLKEEGKYIPFSGEKVFTVFFDDKTRKHYVYQKGKSKFDILSDKNAFKGKSYIKVLLSGNDYSGCGLLLKKPMDISKGNINKTGYLSFNIKLLSDIRGLRIALVHADKPTVESSLNLSTFVDTSKNGWQKVKIPLKRFPKTGKSWDTESNSEKRGKFKWDQLLEVKLFYPEPKGKGKDTRFLLDEMKIKYDGDSKITYQPIYRNEEVKDILYSYFYPEGSTKIIATTEEYHSSPRSLILELDSTEYAGIGLGFKTADLLEVMNKATLEFWVKGKKGEEIFHIGLADSDYDDNIKCINILPITDYIQVSQKWQKVSIQISNFPDKGIFWDGKKEAREDFKFDSVVEFIVRTMPDENPEGCVFYIDDIRVKLNK